MFLNGNLHLEDRLCTCYVFILFCVHVLLCVLVCALQLTSDHGCDLVPADPDAVLDLTDKRGVDGVVHLQYLQLVAVDQHRVWQLS